MASLLLKASRVWLATKAGMHSRRSMKVSAERFTSGVSTKVVGFSVTVEAFSSYLKANVSVGLTAKSERSENVAPPS